LLAFAVGAVFDADEVGFDEQLDHAIDGFPGKAAILGDAGLGGPAGALAVCVVGELEENELGEGGWATDAECPDRGAAAHVSSSQR
jgi:hypothetical protein